MMNKRSFFFKAALIKDTMVIRSKSSAASSPPFSLTLLTCASMNVCGDLTNS